MFDLTQDPFNRFRLYENGNVTITKRHSNAGKDDHNGSDYHKTRVKTGKQTKSFSIDNRVYRKIASSAVRLWNQRKHKIIEILLTFPFDITDEKANECFSKYIDNLEHNYRLNNHIAVREFMNGRPHIHLLADIPFIYVKKLNGAWCHTFSEYFPGSPNALRLGSPKHGTVVHSAGRMVNYMCKYMTKVKNQKFSTRCYFLSHSITSKPQDLSYIEFQYLLQEYKSIIHRCDYCTIVTFLGTSAKDSFFWGWFTESFQNQVDYPLKTCFNSKKRYVLSHFVPSNAIECY